MNNPRSYLADTFGRKHDYLRISLIEKCNLRCTYCMPAQGIDLLPQSHLMTVSEIYQIAKVFVSFGVRKIRLTGGEPLVRKDFRQIITDLSTLNVALGLTTNGVLLDRYIEDFEKTGVNKVNISLDSLSANKYFRITRRDNFSQVMQNIRLAIQAGFELKINVVLVKGVNDNEIVQFVKLTREWPIHIRFIEYMPFYGNQWHQEKVVSASDILNRIYRFYDQSEVMPQPLEGNFTARNYKIKGFAGEFGIISTISNPFCDNCNRIRLTADGKIKNCLFSNHETDILTALRDQKDIRTLIIQSLQAKEYMRGGMDKKEKLEDPTMHNNNRSMLAIGG